MKFSEVSLVYMETIFPHFGADIFHSLSRNNIFVRSTIFTSMLKCACPDVFSCNLRSYFEKVPVGIFK